MSALTADGEDGGGRPPRQVLIAIAGSVERQGGDFEDVCDLVAVRERLHAVAGPRVDAMRREAATRRCCCADGGQVASDGRCERCHGLTREHRR